MTASTQHPFCRIAVSVSRSMGIPSVYVPHAPTALNRTYADIPHDRAFLRGEADRDYYVALGAHGGAIEVVGDAMFSRPESKPTGEPIILLSTGADRPPEQLAETFEMVRRSGVARFGRVMVSPHPRGRGEVARFARRFGFDVVGTRTSQALAEMNVLVMLVQRASGVSLEALAADVPVLVLSRRRNYLFEVELDVPSVERPDQLEAAVEQIAGGRPREHACARGVGRFLAATGPAALAAMMQRAPKAPLGSFGVLDSWRWTRPSGTG